MYMLSVLKDRQSDGEKMKELHTSIKARNQRRKKEEGKICTSGEVCLKVDKQMKRKEYLHNSPVF